MKTAIFVVSVASVLLSGCTYAAKQVLGDEAVPVNTTKAQRLEAAKVFRVRKDGTMYEICKADLNNRAVQAIDVETVEDSDEVVTDKIAGEDITVSIPGASTFQMPYYKTQVNGYVHKKATSPTDDDFYTYFRKSVGKNCRKLIDGGNVVIVQAEARAKKSSQIYKGPVKSIGIGGATVEGIGKEHSVRAPNNVTFGFIPAEK